MLNQQKRWAAKTKFQRTNKTRNSQLLLLCFFILLGGCMTYLMSVGAYALLLAIWTIKTMGEMFFLKKISQKLQSDIPPISHLLFMGIFQILFIPLVAIAQIFQPVTWKKRSYSQPVHWQLFHIGRECSTRFILSQPRSNRYAICTRRYRIFQIRRSHCYRLPK